MFVSSRQLLHVISADHLQILICKALVWRQAENYYVRRNFGRGIEDLITGRNPPVIPQTAIDKYFLGREFVVIIAACSPWTQSVALQTLY